MNSGSYWETRTQKWQIKERETPKESQSLEWPIPPKTTHYTILRASPKPPHSHLSHSPLTESTHISFPPAGICLGNYKNTHNVYSLYCLSRFYPHKVPNNRRIPIMFHAEKLKKVI